MTFRSVKSLQVSQKYFIEGSNMAEAKQFQNWALLPATGDSIHVVRGVLNFLMRVV